MVTKLKEREGWEHEIFENIDWQFQSTAIKWMKANDKKHILKMSHRDLPVIRHQKRFGYSDTNTCPICNREEEIITNMLQCQILINP